MYWWNTYSIAIILVIEHQKIVNTACRCLAGTRFFFTVIYSLVEYKFIFLWDDFRTENEFYCLKVLSHPMKNLINHPNHSYPYFHLKCGLWVLRTRQSIYITQNHHRSHRIITDHTEPSQIMLNYLQRLIENEWDCSLYEVYNDCTVKRSVAVERTSM